MGFNSGFKGLIMRHVQTFQLDFSGHHQANTRNIRHKRETQNPLLFGNLDLSFTNRCPCVHYKHTKLKFRKGRFTMVQPSLNTGIFLITGKISRTKKKKNPTLCQNNISYRLARLPSTPSLKNPISQLFKLFQLLVSTFNYQF